MQTIPISRRKFMAAMAGGTVLGGTTAAALDQYISPAIPDRIPQGEWAYIPTTCRECPAGCGMRLYHRDGRPTKAEGNPLHPVNFGALCPRGQSSVQGLYDPDRLRSPMRRMEDGSYREAGWKEAIAAIAARIDSGGRVSVLSRLETGSLGSLMAQFASTFGGGEPVWCEPFEYYPLRRVNEVLYDTPAIPDYRLDECDVIVSFGADFLENWISPVGYARLFSQMHAPDAGRRGIFLYAGPRRSMSAANADDVLIIPPGMEGHAAAALLKALANPPAGNAGMPEWVANITSGLPDTIPGVDDRIIRRWARLISRAEHPVALGCPAGGNLRSSMRSSLFAALINQATGAVDDGIVDFTGSHAIGGVTSESGVYDFLDGITGDDIVVIHEANPVYHMPGAADALERAGLVVYLGTMMDETAGVSGWVLPVDSPLESWGDYEPVAGCISLIQPAIGRLYDTRPAGDVFLDLAQSAGAPVMLNGAPVDGYASWLDASWRRIMRAQGDDEYAEQRRNALAKGVIVRDAPEESPRFRMSEELATLIDDATWRNNEPAGIRVFAWPTVMWFDGRVSNRGWLQELPDPVNAVTWDSWAEIHPATAAAHGIANHDIIRVTSPAGTIDATVVIRDDIAPDTVAVPYGQGHVALGKNARERGANAFSLFGRPDPGASETTVTIEKTGRSRKPASVAATTDQYGRHILRWTSPGPDGGFVFDPGAQFDLPAPEGYDPRRDIYPPHENVGHRWIMVIDLARCIGCGACTVACFAENNIPVTGEEHVRDGLEQHWLEVIPYRSDGGEMIGFLPMLCQHCDAAPCEPVCPVFAAVHNEEGLNAQIYNRCIGTRYCSNNCPYKVRRFNWYNPRFEKPLDMQLNPDVTVRSRGVMEKCTFCIQRIRRGEHHASREGRPVRDGEIVPACAQTCPADAIIFGDLLDPGSRASILTRTDPRRYHVLEELNTKPGITYLKRVRRNLAEGDG